MAVLATDPGVPRGLEPMVLEKYETIAKLDKMFREAVDHQIYLKWRPYAEKAFNYHRGDQLTTEMLVELRKRGQPEVVENMIRPQRKSFMRTYHNLRLKAAFTGRNLEMDEARAHVFNDLNRHADQQSGFFDEEALAVKDMWIAGQGWLEKIGERMVDGYPLIGTRREDPFVMWADPFGRRRDLRDHRYIIRSKWIDMDEAIERWPEKQEEIRGSVHNSLQMSALHQMFDPSWVTDNEYLFSDSVRGRVRLVEVWYKRRTQRKVFRNAEGQRVALEHLSVKEANSVLKNTGLESDTAFIDEVMVGIYTGTALLHHDRSPYWHGNFPFVSYIYERDINGMPIGWVTEDLMSLQDAVNKRQSKALHLMSTKQVVYTENAVTDDDELSTEVNRPDGLIKLNQVKSINDVFQVLPNVDMGQGQLQMYGLNRAAFNDVGSRNQVGEGQAPGEVRSDRGLARLEQNAIGLDAEVLNGIKASRRDGLLIQTSLIQQFYDDDMIFQITEDANTTRSFLVKRNEFGDLRRFIVDLVLVEENDYATSRQQQLDMLTQTLPQLLSINPAWASIIVGMTDLKDKAQILQQIEAMAAPPKPDPKVSLNLSWADMGVADRVVWAQMMNIPQQLIELMVQNTIPSKTELTVQNDQAKQQSKERMEGERLDLKAAEVRAKSGEHEDDREFDALKTAVQEVTKRTIASQQAQTAKETANAKAQAGKAKSES